MRTVREIFDIAIHLMDEQSEASGATLTADTKEYSYRTPSALNSILNWVYPYSDTYVEALSGRRPVYPAVSGMNDRIDMDDYICLSVLPYGLAARLAEESYALKNWFEQTFLERIEAASRTLPSTEAEIEDCYGGIEYGEYSHW
jgi:hypothetical protein